MSDTPRPIAKALAAAQGEIADPIRSKEMKVPGRPSRMYAGLDDLFRAVRGPLTKHGIAVTQAIEHRDGRTFLVSRLLHESGDSLSSEWELDWKGGPQDKGSALTYAKRYTLSGLCGVADVDDDDAESVSQAPEPKGRGKGRIDTTPSPADRRLADEVKAERAAADASRKASHHPSWAKAHPGFCADVGKMGLNVDIAMDAIGQGGKRPSQMDNAERMEAIAWLRSDAGAKAYSGLVEAREKGGAS